MRFMFRKKRYNNKKSIDDLKKEYDNNGEYRYVVVNNQNIPLWCCKTRQEAIEQVAEEWFWNFRRCKIVDLLFWKDGEPKCKIKRSDFGFEWN